jgi:hypothetical protein
MTNFPFWPQAGARDAPIPPYVLGVGNYGIQRLAEFGTLHPSDENDDRWYGILSLGQGARGRTVLWLKVNAAMSIIDVGILLESLQKLYVC